MRALRALLTLAVLAAAAQATAAKDGCGPAPVVCGAPDSCAHCRRHAACRETACQVVCEIKKEKKYTWCVECEEVCPLLPGRRDRCDEPRDGCAATTGCGGQCCNRCAAACGTDCGGKCCDGCRAKCPVPPRCGHARSVKKLVKKEYEVEVPVYKCVVKYLCGDCCGAESAPPSGAGPRTPAAPAPPAVPPAPPVPAPASKASINDAPPKLVLRF